MLTWPTIANVGWRSAGCRGLVFKDNYKLPNLLALTLDLGCLLLAQTLIGVELALRLSIVAQQPVSAGQAEMGFDKLRIRGNRVLKRSRGFVSAMLFQLNNAELLVSLAQVGINRDGLFQ